MVLRYGLHTKTIDKDIATLKNCSANYTACGYAVGEIVRLLIGWQLNANNPAQNINYSSALLNWGVVTTGFISGLNNDGLNVKGACLKEVEKVAVFLSKAFNNELNLKGLDDLNAFISSLEDFNLEENDIYSACPFKKLLENVNGAMTQEGYEIFKENYFRHLPAIQTEIEFINRCSENLSACGQSASNIASHLLNSK